MIPEKLKQTDERLIELLGDRLSLLAEAGLPVEDQVATVAPLLARLGVPEAIWTKAIAARMTTQNQMHRVTRQVTLIGGRGRMGKFFIEQLAAVGHSIKVLGRQDWDHADKLLGEAELVLISVPIECTVDVIKRAAKYLQPTTALADITSIKSQPVEAMLAHHLGPVIGLHPMFGPSSKSFSGQKVVVCSGRNDDAFRWLLDLMASQGAELIACTAEEHDRMMVIIQATQHFSRFCLGVFLAQENIDLERSLLMSSSNYRLEIDIVKRLLAQNPTLCADIMLATEERCQAIERLASTYSRLAQLVARKDRATLIQEFATTQSFFADQNDRTLQESDRAIATQLKAVEA